MSSFAVGSEQLLTILTRGRSAPPPGRRTEVPGSTLHAVLKDGDESTALCGVECAHVFRDFDWEHSMTSSDDRCPTCAALTESPAELS